MARKLTDKMIKTLAVMPDDGSLINLFFLFAVSPGAAGAAARDDSQLGRDRGLSSNEGPCVFTRFPIAVRVGQDGVTQPRRRPAHCR